jgi:hypothetical protein
VAPVGEGGRREEHAGCRWAPLDGIFPLAGFRVFRDAGLTSDRTPIASFASCAIVNYSNNMFAVSYMVKHFCRFY